MLVLLGALTGGYFSIRTTGALFDFFTFTERAEARISRWEIKEMKGKFPIKSYYSFEAKGIVWHGATQLGEPWHLNEASAVADLQGEANQSWAVWFNRNDPSKSPLEETFPSGLLVRTLICYGVFAYFILGFRLFVKNNYN